MAYDPTNEIQRAFLEGMEEVFSIMFTEHCFMYFLDTENTKTNIYGETRTKVYKDPYELIAKVENSHLKGEEPTETVIRSVTITIPTKQFLDNNIPCYSESDWEEMRKAKFSYEGVTYLVTNVEPKTLVADSWQFFKFSCTEDKKNSIK